MQTNSQTGAGSMLNYDSIIVNARGVQSDFWLKALGYVYLMLMLMGEMFTFTWRQMSTTDFKLQSLDETFAFCSFYNQVI